VQAFFQPWEIKNPEPQHAKLDSFRVRLDKPHYGPSDVVKGELIYNPAADTDIQSVSYQFLGVIETTWSEYAPFVWIFFFLVATC
jgi:hypothetical protein